MPQRCVATTFAPASSGGTEYRLPHTDTKALADTALCSVSAAGNAAAGSTSNGSLAAASATVITAPSTRRARMSATSAHQRSAET